MASKKRVRRVALGYPVTVPWMAVFVRGVAQYAQEQGGWVITTSPPTLAGTVQAALNAFTLKGWPGDGAILAVNTPAEARAAARLKFPVVNLSGVLETSSLPRVMVDHRAMGRMAAEHLLERGLPRLAYCGTPGLWFSQQRALGFCQRAEETGVTCELFEMPQPPGGHLPWHRYVASLDRWLRTLRPPVGLLAIHDQLARVVVDECQRMGLRVPHDVAVLGSENDPTVCEYCQPTLSSVSRNAWEVGYTSAAVLDRLMRGGDPPRQDVLIPPEGVIARQSTDTVAVDDHHVAAAIRFVREHTGEAFTVERMVEALSISRRQLEIRFRGALGCSPHEYLCRRRLEAAKSLLNRPEYIKLQKVAKSCGFSSTKHLRQVFQRLTGMTPLEFHRRCQMERHK